MSALTTDYEAKRRDCEFQIYPVKANAIIYKGALVVDKGNGYAEPGADGSGYLFLGVAIEAVTGGTSDGSKEIRVYKDGSYEYHKASAGQTDIGTVMYIHDDNTVGASSTNSIACGTVVEYVDSTHVRVMIDNYVK